MVQKLKQYGPGKLVIGLTGSFGSGKSTVSRMFEKLGAYVIDADILAHAALLPGSSVYEKILAHFTGLGFTLGKALDRKKIAEIIFQNPKQKAKLEAIVHPYVFERMIAEAAQVERQIIILDIPLLFETGFDQCCHKSIVVKSSDEKIRTRLRKKGFSAEDIRVRSKAQMPLSEKVRRADIVIHNSGTLQETFQEVKKIWTKIMKLSKGVK